MNPVDNARRRFLGMGAGRRLRDTGSPGGMVPQIDVQRCNACDACVHVCAPRALRLDTEEPAYLVDPAACDSCGLCIDVCDRAAIVLGKAAAPAPLRIVLETAICKACGMPHRHAGSATQGYCRFCAGGAAARGRLRLQE